MLVTIVKRMVGIARTRGLQNNVGGAEGRQFKQTRGLQIYDLRHNHGVFI
jgi:hypothetical protein